MPRNWPTSIRRRSTRPTRRRSSRSTPPPRTRLGPDGQLLAGHAAIEKNYVEGFAGPLKGTKLTLQQGQTQAVTPDVKVMEGRFSVDGGLAPLKGRYVNTIVRQGGRWLLASVVTIVDLPAPK